MAERLAIPRRKEIEPETEPCCEPRQQREEVEAGVAVRMAALYLLAGEKGAAPGV